jgi:hypothetical protein
VGWREVPGRPPTGQIKSQLPTKYNVKLFSVSLPPLKCCKLQMSSIYKSHSSKHTTKTQRMFYKRNNDLNQHYSIIDHC